MVYYNVMIRFTIGKRKENKNGRKIIENTICVHGVCKCLFVWRQFYFKDELAPVQDASDISAVEGTELASEVAVSYPLGEQLLSTAIKLSIILAIILVVYVVGKIMKQRKLKQA